MRADFRSALGDLLLQRRVQVAQRIVGSLPVRPIADDLDETLDLAIVVANGRQFSDGPDTGTVPAIALAFLTATPTRDGILDLRHGQTFGDILGIEQELDCPPLNL
jgi:hypothetical protein